MIEQINLIKESLNNCSHQIEGITGKKVEVFYKYYGNAMAIEFLLNIVCNVCDVTLEQILSRSRKSEYVAARHIFCYFAAEVERHAKLRVGKLLGRDHTTVIHAIHHVKNMLDVGDPLYCNLHNSVIKLAYETRSSL